jgi:hypothetical protein
MIDGLWHGIITYGLFALAVGRKSRGGVGLMSLACCASPLLSSPLFQRCFGGGDQGGSSLWERVPWWNRWAPTYLVVVVVGLGGSGCWFWLVGRWIMAMTT